MKVWSSLNRLCVGCGSEMFFEQNVNFGLPRRAGYFLPGLYMLSISEAVLCAVVLLALLNTL